MNLKSLSEDLIFIEKIESIDPKLFHEIADNTIWDDSMAVRKTASYGTPYNYNNMTYAETKFPAYITALAKLVEEHIGFYPNNCLINYYYKSDSKMGFHSDQIDILHENTGIAIFSLGSNRIMKFKSKNDKSVSFEVELKTQSLIYMTQNFQNDWLHAILPSTQENNERISITFRKIKS
ncbi:alpha-ketoglutarate-dependent dioxygenase AlkB [Flavobacterium sp. MC2016-06]|jgi:alkylated DNA repair dioxygenase AlkB|uniref:alpha-ketoglutarate-dependent dioxygenase AlkB n=1 Tax=Flavobacterium sp. MC2016-06 TaxID=2676308 RepID=UPI0012BA5901|nr:alpha-ketoglutarate-dependent dioxygenase AlkB [Flavobacterium sp. MC2016-06]MBU3859324.1 alpha-ketoglutarate-dependent dioxygenase AlkB [Flavobacterium sp. MC2016-06]